MKRIVSLILVSFMMITLFASCSNNSSGGDSKVDFKASYQAVVDAYGEDYVPSMDIDKNGLKEIYGVNTDNVEEFFAQAPMISTHVDTFIAVKAKSGKGADVAKELNAYREKLVSDSMQYPMNVPKINASQVVEKGDYVYFILLGKFDDGTETDEAKMLEFYKTETKRGTDALDKVFA